MVHNTTPMCLSAETLSYLPQGRGIAWISNWVTECEEDQEGFSVIIQLLQPQLSSMTFDYARLTLRPSPAASPPSQIAVSIYPLPRA